MTTEVRFHRVLTVLLTAALLATLTVALTGGQRAEAVDGPVEVVYVATGQNFPDALAGANLAATVGAPMLTVNPDLPIPDPTITALQALDPNQIIILGGPVAVSDAVKGALGDFARSGAVTRIEGGDRHDTAAQIADALPSKVHDADKLDGLDSSAFLRSTGTAGNADKVDGLDAAQLGAIFGLRDRVLEREVVPTDFSAVRTLEVTAPTDGFLLVTSSVYLANGAVDANSAGVYVLYDWNGDATPAALENSVIAIDDVGLAASGSPGSTRTSTLTTAFPVTAGVHTIQIVIESGGDHEYNVPTLAAAFSPNGAADPAGVDLP